jgi:hypothetical protein
MSTKKPPEGIMQYVLVLDSETSGMFNGEYDPSFQVSTGKEHQAVSWGFIVADAKTLKPIKKLYLEIQWNGKSEWAPEAEAVHGLSKAHLQEYGLTEEEAVEEIGNLIQEFWGPADELVLSGVKKVRFPASKLHTMGHNSPMFDLHFLRRLFKRVIGDDFMLNFSHRQLDTNSLGFFTVESYTSDQFFDAMGLPPREKHNALEDASMTLEAARRVKLLWNTFA